MPEGSGVRWSQMIMIGLVLGVTAAAVVWWLERFEVSRLHGEISDYLHRYDKFKQWEAEQQGGE